MRADTNDESETSRSRPLLNEPVPTSCSPATCILKKFCQQIVSVFRTDPNGFTNAYLEVDLVSVVTMERIRELNETNRQKAERLHTELLLTVKSHKNYGEFISVLKKEHVCAELLENIPLSLPGQSGNTCE